MAKAFYTISSWFLKLKTYLLERTDLALLLFLLLMFNYRFSFKIVAILGMMIYRPDFKIKRDGIFYFYIGMITLGIFNILVIHRDYSAGHFGVVFTGCLIWFTCLLAYHQIKLSIDKNSPEKIIETLKVLVIINFLVSMFDILKVIYITKTINPYTQIVPPPYGVSSGDLIGGVFGQLHLVNTVVSCLLVVFFIYQRSFIFAILCLIPFLLTGSNLATLLLISLLLYILILKKDKLMKYYAIFSILLIVIFYTKITPSNQSYMVKTLTKIGDQFKKKPEQSVAKVMVNNPQPEKNTRTLTKEELLSLFVIYKQRLLGDTIPDEMSKQKEVIHYSLDELKKRKEKNIRAQDDFVWYKKESRKQEKATKDFYEYGNLKKFDLDAQPGKITSFNQTKAYLSSNFTTALFGSGIGSFSSRLAFITSGIADDSRILKMIPRYETKEFRENHKAIFKYLMFLDDETHSITNLPFSWYNSLLGEYGLIGCLIFLVFYIGFFVKRARLFSYGKIIFLAMLVFFLFDYWYERLSVVMLFELIMLLDIKIKTTKTDPAP